MAPPSGSTRLLVSAMLSLMLLSAPLLTFAADNSDVVALASAIGAGNSQSTPPGSVALVPTAPQRRAEAVKALAGKTLAASIKDLSNPNCKFTIVNKCKSKKTFAIAVGWDVVEAFGAIGYFGVKYGRTYVDYSVKPLFIWFSNPKIKIAKGKTYEFCAKAKPFNIGINVYPWTVIDIVGKKTRYGSSCAAVGGGWLRGFQKINSCNRRFVVRNC